MAAARRWGGRGLILVATIAILCLVGCGGDEAQATAIILANAANATTTAAFPR
jgi:hypothetical protein